jgi:sugar lactone lactonase YvrE
LLVDLEAGRLATDIRLEGITGGQIRVDTAGTDESTYQMYRPGLAWDLESSLLYIVHADRDRITVVDLEQGEVRQQANIHPAQSWVGRFLGWLATPAQAKAVPGTEKWATLNPEGNRLYVVGLHSAMDRERGSQEWAWNQVPLGLQVIATDDLTVQQRLDLAANNLALSPDGKWLLLTSAYDVTNADGQHERVTSGLYLVDAHTLQVVKHLLPESEVYLHGFSADGLYGYVSTASSEWLGDHWGNWRVQMHLLELESGQILTERDLPGYFLDILP